MPRLHPDNLLTAAEPEKFDTLHTVLSGISMMVFLMAAGFWLVVL